METYIIKVNGVTYEVEVEKKSTGTAPVAQPAVSAAAPAPAPSVSAASPAGEGEAVTTGTAGKVWMKIPVVAPEDGCLTSITVSEGDNVEAGQTVATIA